MKHLKLIFACLLTAILGTGQMWATEETVSWTASSGALGTAISSVNGTAQGTISTGTFSWNYTRTLAILASGKSDYVGMNNGYMQLGSGNAGENVEFRTSNIPGTIKSVTVLAGSKDSRHTGTITVGGTDYNAGAISAWASSAGGSWVGTGTSSGEIVISISCNAKKSPIYIKSITVVYEESAAECSSEITITKADNPANGTFTIDNSGAVCIDEGNATVNVTATPAEHYHLASVTSTVGTVGTISNNTCAITDINANTTVSVTFAENDKYQVTWNVSGDESLKTNVYAGEKPVFPSNPSSCDATSTAFYGWATAPWTGKLDDLSEKTVYTNASAMPDVNAAVTYYAVFAKSSGSASELFSWAGGSSSDFKAIEGVTLSADGTDYAAANAPYLIKWNGTGKYAIIPIASQPGKVSAGFKMIGGATTSTITVQEADDAEGPFTDVENLAISGASNDVVNIESTQAFKSTTRAIKLYYTKGSNVGLGPISIEGAVSYEDYVTTCCTQYNVNIAAGIENGSVSADVAKACEDATVTLTFTPALNYHLSAWTLNGVAQDIADNTFTMPAEAVTVSATFAEDACDALGTPVVTVSGKAYPYDAVKLAWTAIENADKYKVYIYDNDDNELEHNDAFTGVEYTIGQTLNGSTAYKYSVQAISNTPATYCPSAEAESTFNTDALPTAHLTLIDIEGNHASSGDYAILTPFALPSTAASCAKAFYGWTATENYSNASVAPEYKAGDEFTFANTTGVTLYAVYADELTPGAVSYVKTALADIASGSEVVVTEEKGANLWALSYNPSTSKTVAATVTETAGVLDVSGLTNGFWALTKDGDNFSLTVVGGTDKLYCNNSNDGVRVGSGAANTFSINNSYIYTSATTDSRYLGVYNATDFRCYTSINSNITGQTLAFYKKIIGEGTYGNYSTECTENAETPTITPDGSADYYTTAQNVTITAEEGATIYYTTDGSTPTTGSTLYTEAISLSARGEYTIKAIAVKAGKANSNVAEAVIKINLPFANLAELVAANMASGSEVTVTFENEVITDDQTISGPKRAGVMLTTLAANDKAIEIFYNKGTTVVPAEWVIGGKLAATSMTFTWTLFNNQWELVPLGNDWTWDNGDLTYTAPKAVSSVVITGAPAKKSYVDGEKFDPAGLTVTVNYTEGDPEVNPVGVTFACTPERLAKGETSVEVVATFNEVSSETFEVSGLTVGDIQLKTIAEFIAAGNADMRCYLEGVVSDIETGTKLKYGNFNLTDASGTIYVYGCLNQDGEAEKFGTLGVNNGDKIKVIAENYDYYNSKHEAKDVQFVSKKPAATMTFDAMELETGDVETIAPKTITEAEASAVVYSIKEGSDACVTLDGAQITATAEGTATIVATLTETTEYMGSTAEFTVTVTAPDSRKVATGSVFTKISGDLTPNDITFAAHKGDGTTEPIVKDENIRLYKPASGKSTGGYLTITALPGCKIDQVQITFGGNATAAYSKDDAALPTEAFITSKKELLTSAELDAQSVSIVNLKDGSIDISAIKVWYTGEPLPLPEISYSPSIQSIAVGADWSAPTLNNPNGVTIASYSSDNEAVATVTDAGVISLVEDATGTATITAHFAGNEIYREADATYTIFVLSELDALLANSTWVRVDNVATLRAGMQVIVAQYGEGDVKTMGAQNSNNRAAVNATVDGNVLSPATGTQILTLVDAGEGKFAFLTTLTTDNYLYAVSSSSNHLKEEAERDEDGNADWMISISGGKATIIAQGDKTHNWMRYNSGSSLFSCYESGQQDIALYVKADDYNRDVTAGRYGTICLPNGGLMVGAELFEIAYYGATSQKIFLDNVPSGEMVAGRPYIFFPNAPASKLGVIYTDEENASAGSNNGLIGFISASADEYFNIPDGEGNYILQNNLYREVQAGAQARILSNRAYINLDAISPTEPALAPGRRRISMGIQSEQVATGIGNVQGGEVQSTKVLINDQLFILRGEKMYDATGRLVK